MLPMQPERNAQVEFVKEISLKLNAFFLTHIRNTCKDFLNSSTLVIGLTFDFLNRLQIWGLGIFILQQ
jgi:hypothetical protein